MGKLVYGYNVSLDGYFEDETGGFDWSEPNEEVHQFWNDFQRSFGLYLYGRRLYETMMPWETDPSLAASSPVAREYAEVWQAADKVVYSTTLTDVPTARTRIERTFEPDAVRRLKDESPSDVVIGGAELAASAFDAGLIDEIQLVVMPIFVGGGKHAVPGDASRHLELLDTRTFENGSVFLRYRVPNR